jgi:hypothetical protein
MDGGRSGGVRVDDGIVREENAYIESAGVGGIRRPIVREGV